MDCTCTPLVHPSGIVTRTITDPFCPTHGTITTTEEK